MAESQRGQAAAIVTSSAFSISSPKISMFKAKTGFVIPKNKLSGSLVPTFKGVKKSEANDASNGEGNKQTQRKTRWGPDASQDSAVRKGRVFAYQTRVEQITKQLKSGALASGDDQRSRSVETASDHELSSHQTDNLEKLQHLELEKQEAIGEILKLNPSYKTPPDYKPLMKEAIVPLPVKEHAEYNFVGLVFGPSNDTQKRLEKETGSRIQVYGRKSDKGKKVEVTASDGSEVFGSYEELYVKISADSYDKVDAAIVLIELLLASVTEKSAVSTTAASVSREDIHIPSKAQDSATAPFTSGAMQSQGPAGPVSGPLRSVQGDFQQYQGPWVMTGPSHGLSAGFSVSNSPTPLAMNPVYSSASFPFSPSSMSSYGRAPTPVGFASAPLASTGLPPSPQPPMQVFQHPFIPMPHPGQVNSLRNPPVSAPQFLAQPSSVPAAFASHGPTAAGPPRVMGSLTPPLPHQLSSIPSSRPPEGQFAPLVSSTTGWTGPPLGPPQSLGPSNTLHSSQRPQAMALQPIAPSRPSASGQQTSGPPFHSPRVMSSASPMIPRPLDGPAFLSQNQSAPVIPVQQFTPHGPARNLSPNAPLGSTPIPSSAPATPRLLHSGVPSPVPAPSFTPLSNMAGAGSRPQQSMSGDFTFQPRRPPPPPLVAQSIPASHSGLASVMQPPGPRPPPFQPALQNTAPRSMVHGHLRAPMSDQMGQRTLLPPVSFGGNPGNFGPSSMKPQMGPRNPSLVQLPNVGNQFPSGPRSSIQFQQNYPPAPPARPGNVFGVNQNLGSNIPFATAKPVAGPGGQQIYDPFSPTSAPAEAQPPGSRLSDSGKQENDPEYEDLMASVGVK